MADEVKYILAPVEILRGVMDCPDLLIARTEGLFRRQHGIGIGIDIDNGYLMRVMTNFETIPKCKCVIPITREMIQYVAKVNDSEFVFEETKQRRITATVGLLALASICGRIGGWKQTNNKHFVARMAGYRNWEEFVEAGEDGILSCYYNMTEKTIARHCNGIKQSIKHSFDNVEFRQAETRRGWEFTTKHKQQ